MLLRVPTGWDEYAPLPVLGYLTQMVWRGWTMDDCILEGRPPSYVELGCQGALTRLHDAAMALAHGTGCDPEEAVAFLLCDHTPWMPCRTKVRYDADCDATLIRVRHP